MMNWSPCRRTLKILDHRCSILEDVVLQQELGALYLLLIQGFENSPVIKQGLLALLPPVQLAQVTVRKIQCCVVINTRDRTHLGDSVRQIRIFRTGKNRVVELAVQVEPAVVHAVVPASPMERPFRFFQIFEQQGPRLLIEAKRCDTFGGESLQHDSHIDGSGDILQLKFSNYKAAVRFVNNQSFQRQSAQSGMHGCARNLKAISQHLLLQTIAW